MFIILYIIKINCVTFLIIILHSIMRYIITTRVLHLIFIYLELILTMARNQSAMQELTLGITCLKISKQ